MKLVYNSLTFYDSPDKRDVTRTKAVIPVYSPRHQLPPFIINLGSDTIGTIDKIELMTDAGEYSDIGANAVNGYISLSYDTFTISGHSITSAIASGASGANIPINVNLNAGDTVTLEFTLTVNSGQAPSFALYDDLGAGYIELVPSAAGVNSVTLYAYRALTSAKVVIYNSSAGNWATDAIVIKKGNITNHFQTIPAVYTSASLGDVIEYKGAALKYPLPLGLYYIKITADGYVYYSDYIMVDDIYTNLITGWTNDGFNTFSSLGRVITGAVEAATGACKTDGFAVRKGETINLIFYANLASGTGPTISLKNAGGTNISNTATLADGVNVVNLVATSGTTAYLTFTAGAACNFTTGDVFVQRTYSPYYTKIKVTNTTDVGYLLYADSFYQEFWLSGVLNNPTHEDVKVGEEKNGIFIAEKIVTKHQYTFITWVSRAVYSALERLPQHTTITITDECGETYTPSMGNVVVEPAEWTYYDTAKVVIKWNDGANSQYVWTR